MGLLLVLALGFGRDHRALTHREDLVQNRHEGLRLAPLVILGIGITPLAILDRDGVGVMQKLPRHLEEGHVRDHVARAEIDRRRHQHERGEHQEPRGGREEHVAPHDDLVDEVAGQDDQEQRRLETEPAVHRDERGHRHDRQHERQETLRDESLQGTDRRPLGRRREIQKRDRDHEEQESQRGQQARLGRERRHDERDDRAEHDPFARGRDLGEARAELLNGQGRLFHQQQDGHRDEQEQRVDDAREREGDLAPGQGWYQQLALGTLVVVPKRHQVVVRHRVEVDARHLFEDRRDDAVAGQVERGPVEHGAVLEHARHVRVAGRPEEMRHRDGLRVWAAQLHHLGRVVGEDADEMREPGAAALALTHPALVELGDAVTPDDLHVLRGARLELQLRRGHREGRCRQEFVADVEAVRVREYPAGGINRRHLSAHLLGALEDPGLVRVRPRHGLEHREIHLDLRLAQVADGLAQGLGCVARALVQEHEVQEDRARMVDRERFENFGVAEVRFTSADAMIKALQRPEVAGIREIQEYKQGSR